MRARRGQAAILSALLLLASVVGSANAAGPDPEFAVAPAGGLAGDPLKAKFSWVECGAIAFDYYVVELRWDSAFSTPIASVPLDPSPYPGNGDCGATIEAFPPKGATPGAHKLIAHVADGKGNKQPGSEASVAFTIVAPPTPKPKPTASPAPKPTPSARSRRRRPLRQPRRRTPSTDRRRGLAGALRPSCSDGRPADRRAHRERRRHGRDPAEWHRCRHDRHPDPAVACRARRRSRRAADHARTGLASPWRRPDGIGVLAGPGPGRGPGTGLGKSPRPRRQPGAAARSQPFQDGGPRVGCEGTGDPATHADRDTDGNDDRRADPDARPAPGPALRGPADPDAPARSVAGWLRLLERRVVGRGRCLRRDPGQHDAGRGGADPGATDRPARWRLLAHPYRRGNAGDGWYGSAIDRIASSGPGPENPDRSRSTSTTSRSSSPAIRTRLDCGSSCASAHPPSCRPYPASAACRSIRAGRCRGPTFAIAWRPGRGGPFPPGGLGHDRLARTGRHGRARRRLAGRAHRRRGPRVLAGAARAVRRADLRLGRHPRPPDGEHRLRRASHLRPRRR